MKSNSQHFKRGLESLDDIQSLGQREILPLIQQAQFHFAGLKSSLDEQASSMQGLSSINRLLGHYFEMSITKYFHRTVGAKQLNSFIDNDKMDLVRWNRVVESLPLMVALADIFDFKELISITLDDGFLKIGGRVFELDGVLKERAKVYSLFRALCNKKVLTTYSVEDSKGGALIELIFDLRENPQLVYAFHWRELSFFGLSHIFSHYKVSEGEVKSFLCSGENQAALFYHISDRFTLERVDNPSKLQEHAKESFEILHFPFLFRSLSLIIPRKGEVYPIESFDKTYSDSVVSTGCGIQHSGKQEVSPSHRKLHFIDFFKLVTDES